MATSGRRRRNRDDETGEEQQVVDPVENVLEPEADEPERRLAPARIQAHQAGVPTVVEGSDAAVSGHEPQDCLGPLPEARQRRIE